MKTYHLYLALCFTLLACHSEPKTKLESKSEIINYPSDISNVFKAHGGIEKWNSYEEIQYEMVKDGESEFQVIQLNDRREYVKGSNFETGFDGLNYWVKADTTAYKGNPKFYHNLMFYFYAMPFVLGDPGIKYATTEALEYENVSYPGIAISYQDSIGLSPKDEYFIYYHPDSYQMEWLGYTVTYFSGEKSPKKSFIKYGEWQKVGDLLLPSKLTWYKSVDGKILDARGARTFENVKLSADTQSKELFHIPSGGRIVE